MKSGNKEPAAVKDEGIWDKAKKAVLPRSDKYDTPYAVVMDVYKKMGGRVGGKKKEEASVEPGTVVVDLSGEDKVRDLLVKNPRISGATLLNQLKASGFKIIPPEQKEEESGKEKEADSASSVPAATRAGVAAVNPLKRKKESGSINFVTSRLLEKAASDDGIGPTKFKAVLIQEGLGNLKDRYYYTKDALQSAINVFEGKKIYADHPSSIDEQTRPERSVRDVLGYFENVAVEESEDGRSMVTADVKLLDEPQYSWARGLMRHAIEYSKKFSDKDFVGLSINASGDAEETPLDEFLKETDVPESALPKLQKAKEEGIDSVRQVHRITDAVSVDLVTEAGAGGRVLEMIEQEKQEMKKKQIKAKEAEEKKMKANEAEEEEKKEAGDAGGPPGAPAQKAAPKVESEEDDKGGDDGDGDHDDADQDKELIKKMLKKHLGDKSDEGDEAMAKEMYANAKELGYEGEEAEEAAGHALKMVKHMAAKKEDEAEESEDGEESEESEEKKEAMKDDGKQCEAEEDEAEEKKKESEIVKLHGRIAMLEKTVGEFQTKEHVEKLCRESGLPMSVTKKFRESIGTVKSTKDVDEKFKLFKEAFDAARGEADELRGLHINVEKVVSEGIRKINLADCKN